MAATRVYKPSAYSWANNAVSDYMKSAVSATNHRVDSYRQQGTILPDPIGFGIRWADPAPAPVINPLSVKRVIHNPPATIVIWQDDTKTVVKCGKNDEYDEYFGFCVALAKRVYGTSRKAKKESQKGIK